MRYMPALILGFILLATQSSSATNPPNEVEIEAQIQALMMEKAKLERELQTAKSMPYGVITAEVHGTMKKDERSYYILTRIERGEEVRVWLQAYTPEIQTTYQKLLNKDVIAKGQMFQNDHDVYHTMTKVPARGMYFRTPTVRASKEPEVVPLIRVSPAPAPGFKVPVAPPK